MGSTEYSVDNCFWGPVFLFLPPLPTHISTVKDPDWAVVPPATFEGFLGTKGRVIRPEKPVPGGLPSPALWLGRVGMCF